MSATLSEATGRPYGIACVRRGSARARRSTPQTREQQRHKGEEPARRGPTPTVSDATLLEAIQADLDRSPFQGEGHRKVHARLRIFGIRVAQTRVLLAGAQAALPAPRPPGRRAGACRDDRHAGAERDVGHRRRAGLHVGRRVGLDLHIEHWNGVCGYRVQGWEPVCGARADRPGAPAHLWRPRRTALEGWRCGWTTSQYLSDHFLNQIRYWGIGPAALSRNRKRTAWRSGGIARSRSKRSTGASSRTSRRYAPRPRSWRVQQTWRLEKLGYHTPIEAREAHELLRAA